MTDARLQSAAAQRNRDAILVVLRDRLAPEGRLLEIASGTGEHVAHFAAAMPGWVFQPSDPEPERQVSIDAWSAAVSLGNVLPALALDATASAWPVSGMDAVLCINMIHIAPWAAARGLFRNAARTLVPGGKLFLYGPFKRDGAHTAPSNAEFDLDLRGRNAEWGIRDLEMVAAEAEAAGFGAPAVVAMPVNNLTLAFRLERSWGG